MRPRRLSTPLRFLAVSCLGLTFACGQEEDDLPQSERDASAGSILTRANARTITQRIPAPRGQIVDRDGEPLAQNIVAYQLALQFKQFDSNDRAYVLSWARPRMELAKSLIKDLVIPGDDELYAHYRDRRWLPLILSTPIGEKEAKELQSKAGQDLILHPVYRRYYPDGGLAAHVLGFTGSVGPLPKGPINFNEPLFEEIEGRSGLERIYDKRLMGEAGTLKLLFDESGEQLLSEQTKRPRAGGTVVTTLNARWQRHAEKVLEKGCRRGAFVVLDAVTGEVLVLASKPTFNLNTIDKEYKNLASDPNRPMVALAYQGVYPPASTFKPIVALAALNTGTVTADTEIYCPAAVQIGNHVFNNWSKTPEGAINVKRALARSTNPWFYQVGIKVGPSAFLNLSRRLGFGERTGLPLTGETAGLVPTNEWFLANEKRRILDGDTANLSIGQGVLLASPLQVAQAMAGIANGGALPKLQLVRQVQDDRGRVIEATHPDRRVFLGLEPDAVAAVREGMRDVVNSSYGTGSAARLSFTEMCGKTGTAQWGPPSKNQRLAWFAGFFPYENPRYSFAVLYEGRPGQKVSGGRMAAPMVKAFFEEFKDELKETIAPPLRALVIAEDAEGAPIPTAEDGIMHAIPVEIPEDGGEPVPVGREIAPLPDFDEEEPLRATPVDIEEIEPDPAWSEEAREILETDEGP